MKKTNAMRILDKLEISYLISEHEYDELDVTGASYYKKNNIDTSQIFKTIVLEASSKRYYVAVVQSDDHIDLKKLANVVSEKSISVLKLNDLKKITGYERGGCSPIGMKKNFDTYIDKKALEFNKISISGGKRGVSITLNIEDLLEKFNFKVEEIV